MKGIGAGKYILLSSDENIEKLDAVTLARFVEHSGQVVINEGEVTYPKSGDGKIIYDKSMQSKNNLTTGFKSKPFKKGACYCEMANPIDDVRKEVDELIETFTIPAYPRELFIPDEYKTKPLKRGRYVSARPKSMINRNDPCPCGSGKKFKKCCINKTNK